MPILSRSPLPHALAALALCVGLAMAAAPSPAAAEPGWATDAGWSTYRCSESEGRLQCTTRWGEGSGLARVIRIMPPRDEADRAAAEQRLRIWTERCRPVIHQDRYGVGRYHYAAAGCEFGRLHD